MVTTLFLAGFPDFLSLCGRITGQYPSSYLVVSLFCFGAGFCWLMVYFWVVFLYLDIAVRGSNHFSSSVACKHKENRSHLLCVQDEIMSHLWLKKESVITSYFFSFDVHASFLHVAHLFMHTVTLWAGQVPRKHTQLAYNGGKGCTYTGTHQSVIIITCRNMYCTDSQSLGLYIVS